MKNGDCDKVNNNEGAIKYSRIWYYYSNKYYTTVAINYSRICAYQIPTIVPEWKS